MKNSNKTKAKFKKIILILVFLLACSNFAKIYAANTKIESDTSFATIKTALNNGTIYFDYDSAVKNKLTIKL